MKNHRAVDLFERRRQGDGISLLAARAAEELRRDSEVQVEVVKGDFLELSVDIDGQKVIDTNRLWYPLPSSLVRRTRELLVK